MIDSGPEAAGTVHLMMCPDEIAVYAYLKPKPTDWVGWAEIGRRFSKRPKFREDPSHILPILERMQTRGILERNSNGEFRLRPRPPVDASGKTWVAPHLFKMLEARGKRRGNLITVEDDDAYYYNL